MVLAIDIGNSYISVGLLSADRIIKSGSFTTPKHMTITEAFEICNKYESEAVVIASVVPKLTRPFLLAGNDLKRKTFEITHKSKTGLRFDYHDPSTIGSDRIANAVAGLKYYNQNLIIIDFGTATTFDVVAKEGLYRGGVICPGIDSSLEAMVKGAALIPAVELKIPENVVGKNTAECVRSGIIYMTIGQVKEVIRRIDDEIGVKHLIVATGGWGGEIKKFIDEIENYDPYLTLKGIYEIYLLNQ